MSLLSLCVRHCARGQFPISWIDDDTAEMVIKERHNMLNNEFKPIGQRLCQLTFLGADKRVEEGEEDEEDRRDRLEEEAEARRYTPYSDRIRDLQTYRLVLHNQCGMLSMREFAIQNELRDSIERTEKDGAEWIPSNIQYYCCYRS